MSMRFTIRALGGKLRVFLPPAYTMVHLILLPNTRGAQGSAVDKTCHLT